MLKINDLRVNYGGIEAVKGISFDVPEKSIVTLIGANGAGKSTTLRSIAGLVKASRGSISFLGEEILGTDTPDIVAKGISLVPEGRRVFPDMTVIENIKIGAYLRKDSLEEDINWVYDLFPRLKERSWQLAGTLSGGEQQMLAVGRAMMAAPKLMMLDEPSLGLAPIIIDEMFEKFKQINKLHGTTLLIVEQNAQLALETADTGYILNLGKIQLKGPGSQLLDDPYIQEAYLGFK